MNLAAEFEWVRDTREYLLSAARPGDRERAEPEHAPDDSLIYSDCLDLAEQRLVGLSLDETDFAEYPFVSDGKFGCDVADPGTDGEQKTDAGEAESRPGVHRLEVLEKDPQTDAEQHDNDRR